MAITAYGEPLAPMDLPEPEVPHGYALLEVVTCGVCFSDVKTSRGHMPYSDRLPLPHVPGHEIFGRVLRTNPPGLLEEGTSGTVFHYWPCGRCASCRRGDETLCSRLVGWAGFTHPGGFQERIAVPVDRLVPIPASVDPVLAAPMSCALGTAYRSVVVRGGVRAGTTVAVMGLGGVGIHAAQVARAAGARVVGFDLHEATLTAAKELGLDARIGDDGAIEALRAEVGGEGLDVVLDTVGHAATLEAADRLVRPGGRIVGVGYAPGTVVAVPTPRLVLGELELVGSRYAHRGDLERAIALVASGLVRPIVSLVRPLEGVNEVFAALEAGDVVGRAVLDVAGVRE
ncbi:MAG TPA: zinc-binding dehydrogenase [Actinomycetota bacterium]|jgi:D-arabinose 1-dehydrogenase-like Zn-dependent alcohol dehydrogenase|nr:zinc-binding dehydrogenase [Actinomycetota bacterium]